LFDEKPERRPILGVEQRGQLRPGAQGESRRFAIRLRGRLPAQISGYRRGDGEGADQRETQTAATLPGLDDYIRESTCHGRAPQQRACRSQLRNRACIGE
jgi:hypothetical protein